MKRKSFKAPFFIVFIASHIQAIRVSMGQLSLSLLSTFATFAVIGVALALPFGLYTLLQNFQGISHSLNDSAQISLYLNPEISDLDKSTLLRVLNSDSGIQHIQYISPEEGLEAFQKDSGFSEALSGFKTNPLPAVYVIQPSIRDNLQLQQLFSRLKQLPNVSNAQLDMQWLQRFNAILLLLHHALIAVMLLFALGVLLIIGNTIRLTTQYYRDEIKVIKLIGGSDRFIRRPFLYSGVIYGLSGSIIAWLLVDATMEWLQGPASKLAALYGTNFEIQGLTLNTTLVLIIGGCLLGLIGSWLTVKQHIKAIEPD